ncbi:MAG: hypothetical protein KFF73_17020 [Cyclobacteriaceae bacterium]|nr:hypothetical protein [Cyclobacteriaceae bacterium]
MKWFTGSLVHWFTGDFGYLENWKRACLHPFRIASVEQSRYAGLPTDR